jgi:hypothetical protein
LKPEELEGMATVSLRNCCYRLQVAVSLVCVGVIDVRKEREDAYHLALAGRIIGLLAN